MVIWVSIILHMPIIWLFVFLFLSLGRQTTVCYLNLINLGFFIAKLNPCIADLGNDDKTACGNKHCHSDLDFRRSRHMRDSMSTNYEKPINQHKSILYGGERSTTFWIQEVLGISLHCRMMIVALLPWLVLICWCVFLLCYIHSEFPVKPLHVTRTATLSFWANKDTLSQAILPPICVFFWLLLDSNITSLGFTAFGCYNAVGQSWSGLQLCFICTAITSHESPTISRKVCMFIPSKCSALSILVVSVSEFKQFVFNPLSFNWST